MRPAFCTRYQAWHTGVHVRRRASGRRTARSSFRAFSKISERLRFRQSSSLNTEVMCTRVISFSAGHNVWGSITAASSPFSPVFTYIHTYVFMHACVHKYSEIVPMLPCSILGLNSPPICRALPSPAPCGWYGDAARNEYRGVLPRAGPSGNRSMKHATRSSPSSCGL